MSERAIDFANLAPGDRIHFTTEGGSSYWFEIASVDASCGRHLARGRLGGTRYPWPRTGLLAGSILAGGAVAAGRLLTGARAVLFLEAIVPASARADRLTSSPIATLSLERPAALAA